MKRVALAAALLLPPMAWGRTVRVQPIETRIGTPEGSAGGQRGQGEGGVAAPINPDQLLLGPAALPDVGETRSLRESGEGAAPAVSAAQPTVQALIAPEIQPGAPPLALPPSASQRTEDAPGGAPTGSQQGHEEGAPLSSRLGEAQAGFDEAKGGGGAKQGALVNRVFREGGGGGAGGGLAALGGDGAETAFPNRMLPRGSALRLVGTDPEREPQRQLGDKEGWAEVGEFEAPGRTLVVKIFASVWRPISWLWEVLRTSAQDSVWAARNELMSRWFLRRFFNHRLDTVDAVGYFGGWFPWLLARPVVVMGKAKAMEDPWRLSALPLATRAALGVFFQARGLTDVNPKNVLLPKGSLFKNKIVAIDMERPVQKAGNYGMSEMPWTSTHFFNRLDAHFTAEIARLRAELSRREAEREIKQNMRDNLVRHPRRRGPLLRTIQDNVANLESILNANFLEANRAFLQRVEQGGLDRSWAGFLSAINRAAAESEHGGVLRDMVRAILIGHGALPDAFWSGADREPWVLHAAELEALRRLVLSRGGGGLMEGDWLVGWAEMSDRGWDASYSEQDLRDVFLQLGRWVRTPPPVPHIPPPSYSRAGRAA